jgi:hypothetical protein
MSKFGDDLTQALGEALAHVKGEGKAIVHPAVDSAKVLQSDDPEKLEGKRPSGRHSGAA